MGNWTEQWAIGEGQSRVYCVIARTDNGLFVNVFEGETRVESVRVFTYQDATRLAHLFSVTKTRRHGPSATPAMQCGDRSSVVPRAWLWLLGLVVLLLAVIWFALRSGAGRHMSEVHLFGSMTFPEIYERGLRPATIQAPFATGLLKA